MSDDKKIIAYRLEPVYEAPKGGLRTAACMHCMLTGEMLSGHGGGGYFLSPKVVDAIRDGKVEWVEQKP